MYGALKESLSRKRVLDLLRAGLGDDIRVRAISRCRGGLFNTSYRVQLAGGGFVVLRVAPPDDRSLLLVERGLLRREAAMIPALRAASVPAPRILFRDFSRRRIPRDYVIVEGLSGKNWFYLQKQLSADENEHLMGELGAMMRRVHSALNTQRWFGYPAPFRRHKSWFGFLCEYAQMLECDLRRHPYGGMPREFQPTVMVKKAKALLDEVAVPHLVHGDMWPRNVLVERQDGRWTITGLLDGDRALWGDPRFEWVLFAFHYPAVFWKKYGVSPSGSKRDHLRTLLYRGCGGIQASLEEAIHFRHRKAALQMLEYSKRDFGELSKSL